MTFRVRTTKRAEADIEYAYWWIAEHEREPLNALRWLDGLEIALDSLRELPLRCSSASESTFFDRDIRQLLYHSHRVLFAVSRDEVVILHIRHGSRLLANEEELEE